MTVTHNTRFTRLLARFWTKVQKTETCWLWTAQLNTKGYGCFVFYTRTERPKGRSIYAHRLSWMLVNGPIPDGMNVLHRCDTPACVNPAHLFIGTQAENMADAARKGRICRVGRPLDKRKLTDDDVRAIRADPRTYRDIAALYGVSHGYISAIKEGRARKSLDPGYAHTPRGHRVPHRKHRRQPIQQDAPALP